MDQPTTPATPRVLRINVLAERVRPLLADVDAWRAASGNCGGQHSIQQCSDIRRLLFAA